MSAWPIDPRTTIELSVRDSRERIVAVARAAAEQCCDIVITDVVGPITDLVAVLSHAVPGSTLTIRADGPVWYVAVVQPDLVRWERAHELAAATGFGSPRRAVWWKRLAVWVHGAMERSVQR